MVYIMERAIDAPALQTRLDVNPTLIVSWFCTIFSLVVTLIRVLGRWVRTERLFREDKVMLWSIVPLLIRMAFVHPVLLWGTNNTQTFALTAEQIYYRSLGSRLVLGSRIFYAIYIWVAKVTVLEFVQRMISTSWTKFYERGARLIYVFLGLTLAAVIISTLAECQPFDHYWQVVPDPGRQCRIARGQLITMATCDIITDVVLIIWPIPLVIMSKMPLVKKVSMVALFLLSLVLIAITGYRVPSTAIREYSQQYRSLLASIEILAATCVSNVIAIGSFLRDKGVKKIKFRADSTLTDDDDEGGNVLTRPATRTIKPSVAQRHWGSDEDLVRDFGVFLSRDLRHEATGSSTARLAPTAEPASEPYHDIEEPEPTINPQGRGLLDPAWTFRKGSTTLAHPRRDSEASSDSDSSTDFKLQKLEPYTDEPVIITAPPETPYKKMNFFDVGGLMNTNSSEHSSFDQASRRLSNAVSNQTVSRSGQNFIADVGGLLATSGSRENTVAPVPPVRDSVYRPTNLLLPDQTIKETRHPSTGHDSPLMKPHESTLASSTTKTHLQDDGPDALKFSDAGGLLR